MPFPSSVASLYKSDIENIPPKSKLNPRRHPRNNNNIVKNQMENPTSSVTSESQFIIIEERPSEDTFITPAIAHTEAYRTKVPPDIECGEPSRFQHFKIDFTPIKGVDDNEELLQKCIDFWKFVNTEPKLKDMMVVPENKILTESKVEEMVKNVQKMEGKTAVEWTEVLPRLPLNYLGMLTIDQHKKFRYGAWSYKHKREANHEVTYKSKAATPRASQQTKKICEDMEKFDRMHPKFHYYNYYKENTSSMDLIWI